MGQGWTPIRVKLEDRLTGYPQSTPQGRNGVTILRQSEASGLRKVNCSGHAVSRLTPSIRSSPALRQTTSKNWKSRSSTCISVGGNWTASNSLQRKRHWRIWWRDLSANYTGKREKFDGLNEPLTFQTSIKLPFVAFSDEKGDSGTSRNPLCF